MTNDWQSSRQFYASLCLQKDGDDVEKYGVENYQLDRRWPAYETFWKLYVAPATNRPRSLTIRDGVSQEIRDLILANYKTHSWVISACDYTSMLKPDLGFTRTDDWKRLFSCHDNALTEFSSLQTAVEKLLTDLDLRDLAFLSTANDWSRELDIHLSIQDDLRHLEQDSLEIVDRNDSQVALFRHRSSYNLHGDDSNISHPAPKIRQPISDFADDHLNHLIDILNSKQDRLVTTLAPAISMREFYQHCGWYHG